MDYVRLREELKEITQIAESVPEPFKQKCFEVLLTRLLATGAPATVPAEAAPDRASSVDLPVTTQLRVFLQRTGLAEEDLKRVVMVAENEVHFVKEPASKAISDGQIQWSLLLALKNCILNNAFSVDPEEVRSACQDKGYYDQRNFARTFKRPGNAKFFKGTMEAQGEPQQLTNEGQKELAALVHKLAEDA